MIENRTQDVVVDDLQYILYIDLLVDKTKILLQKTMCIIE